MQSKSLYNIILFTGMIGGIGFAVFSPSFPSSSWSPPEHPITSEQSISQKTKKHHTYQVQTMSNPDVVIPISDTVALTVSRTPQRDSNQFYGDSLREILLPQ